jgi:hypothetical protein
MTSPQKAKGNAWERQVAEHLTNLYGERFIRVPHSGAYIGGTNSARKEFLHEGQIRSFKGDIIPGQSFPRFNTECKSYKDFPFHQLYSGEVKILDAWLGQLLEVADPGDYSILIMKFNRKGKFVAVQDPVIGADQGYSVYNSTKHGRWWILEYDLFWLHNKEAVKGRCA